MYSLTKGNIVILQKSQGHWCTMTLRRGQFALEKTTNPEDGEAYMGVSGLDAAHRDIAACRFAILT